MWTGTKNSERRANIGQFRGAFPSIDELDRAAAGARAHVGQRSSEGRDPGIPLVASINGTLAPALSLEMLRVALHSSALRLQVAGPAVQAVSVGNFTARPRRMDRSGSTTRRAMRGATFRRSTCSGDAWTP